MVREKPHPRLRGLEITFTPLGARRFLGVPLDTLANRVVEFEDVLGGTPILVERLYEAADWPARFALLDAAIEARAAQSPAAPAEVVWAWRRLAQSEGRVPASGRIRPRRAVTPPLACAA